MNFLEELRSDHDWTCLVIDRLREQYFKQTVYHLLHTCYSSSYIRLTSALTQWVSFFNMCAASIFSLLIAFELLAKNNVIKIIFAIWIKCWYFLISCWKETNCFCGSEDRWKSYWSGSLIDSESPMIPRKHWRILVLRQREKIN